MNGDSILIGEHGVWWGPERQNLWGNGGQAVLPKANDEAAARAHVLRYEKGEEYYCSGYCDQWHPRPWELRHFAGCFCANCAERYKAAHSGVCLLCRAPRWACVC